MHAFPRALAIVALGAGLLALAPSAQAMRADGPPPATASRQALDCKGQLLGIDAQRRFVNVVVVNGEATNVARSERLSFDPSALGHVSTEFTARGEISTATAVADRGRPRLLVIKRRQGSTRITVQDRRIDSPDFQPRLFADTYSYRVYAIWNGTLTQWYLTQTPSGKLLFGHRRKVGTGFGKLQSLQNQGTWKIRRQVTDVLYYTTKSGELGRLLVPADDPKRHVDRVISETGYEGVTDLSTAFCNGKEDHHLVMAVDPEAGVATWTTITEPFVRNPAVVQRGELTGFDWHLHATY